MAKATMGELLNDIMVRMGIVERRLRTAGSASRAAGLIQAYGGSVPPSGWLFCNGAAVSRTDYPALFAAIGTAWGVGDGSTTFNLPDGRGRVLVGLDPSQTEFDTLGEAGGAKTHTHTEGDLAAAIGATNSEVGSISYQAGSVNGRGPTTVTNYSLTGLPSTAASRTFNHHTRVYGTTASGGSLQPYRVANFIISIGSAATEGGGDPDITNAIRAGSNASRDAYFGIPGTDAERVALANQRITWWNTDTGRAEIYYTLNGLSGLTAPGLAAGFSSGWYPLPSGEWAAKAGPSSWVSTYRATFAIGRDTGGTVDAHTNASAIIIGMTGQYEVVAMQRGNGVGVPNGYIGLGLNGSRTDLQGRTTGVWYHDHSAANNQYTTSRYIGLLNAGELITCGAPDATTAGYLSHDASSHTGGITVRRIS
jgi:microcystin-dependent protein